MIRKLKVLSLVLFTVLGVGCSTQSIMVNVHTPLRMELPPGIRSFVVFSRFVPAEGDYDRIIWGAYESVDSVMLAASDTCYRSFDHLLGSYDRYVTRIPKAEPMLRHNGDSLPDPLPWEGLLKISKRNFSHAIIILESFSIDESEIIVSQEGDKFLAKVELDVSTGWRFYQPKLRRTLDENVYVVRYSIQREGDTKLLAIEALPAKQQRFIMAGVFAGEEYAKFMKPGVIELKRKYYIKGDPVIEDAAEMIANDEWSKAERKWDYNAYNGESDKLKAMCSYNMALKAEKEGYLYKALGFARRAQKLMPAKLHLELINELTMRSLDLEEQIKSGKIIKNW
ncbi:MAG: DUF6340 family protein [Bacteroidota bacterium]|nr:DUF6340 family protein [Bacteroidota bacterium]